MSSYILITGASRGLGLEFVKQLSARPNTTVIATARNPDKADELKAIKPHESSSIIRLTLDVDDEKSIQNAAKVLKEEHKIDSLDLLINNAGTSTGGWDPVLECKKATLLKTVETNVVGTLQVTQTFWPFLKNAAKNGKKPKVGIVGSIAGSIAATKTLPFSGLLGYRASKAALHMVGALFALQGKEDGITVLIQEPGHVETDLGTLGGAVKAPFQPPEAIASVLKVWDAATEKDNGTFFNYDGKINPW